jgi:hypothetical protein
MSQAKQRGTFKQRLAAAQERNERLAEMIEKLPDEAFIKKVRRRHGIQKAATTLIAHGIKV